AVTHRGLTPGRLGCELSPALKQFGLVLLAQTWSFIPHPANDSAAFGGDLNPDGLAWLRELKCIRDEIVENGRDHHAVGPHWRNARRGLGDDSDLFGNRFALVEGTSPLSH